jgi:hypothetical protein
MAKAPVCGRFYRSYVHYNILAYEKDDCVRIATVELIIFNLISSPPRTDTAGVGVVFVGVGDILIKNPPPVRLGTPCPGV